MSLFAAAESENRRSAQPLAARMRPASLDEFVGQEHFLGEGKLLRRLLAADRLGSVIFYGPPGTGKTTLAHLLANATRSRFRQMSAVTSGVKELREVLEEARDLVAATGQRTLLFIDEIHRFNRAQQDVLLPDVEEGAVILVGATTHNPFFALTSALVSRSRVFEFKPLSIDEIKSIIHRALADKQRGLGNEQVQLDDDALEFLAEVSDGDARRALGALEIGVLSTHGAAAAIHQGLGGGVGATKGRELRQSGGCALRRGQRADQEHSRQRSRRSDLLAGGDARRGRGRAISYAPAGDLGQRGCGKRRSPSVAAGRGGDASVRVRRFAGVPVNVGPGGHVFGLCAQKQRRYCGHWRSATRRAGRPHACPCRCTCVTSIIRGHNVWVMAKVTNMPTMRPMPWPRRIIWAWSGSITAPWIGDLSKNWRARLEQIRRRLKEAKANPDSS